LRLVDDLVAIRILSQGAPRTCRCIETRWRWRCTARSKRVREHHAPVGALRQDKRLHAISSPSCQGAPRTCRCIETTRATPIPLPASGQGAPRTCRCIETAKRPTPLAVATVVREHHAPVGALRRAAMTANGIKSVVREHHAPVGALRLIGQRPHLEVGVVSGSTTHL